jgi:peroxiredoxin
MSIYRHFMAWLGAEGTMSSIVQGSVAPNFSLKDLSGKQFVLSDALRRGPVVVAFYKRGCPVCQFTFPFLERLYKKYGAGSVSFVGVSQNDAKGAQEFAKEYGITFPIVIDEAGYPASNAYGLTNVPTYFLIDEDGTVLVASVGFGKAELEVIADQLADRQQVPHAPVFRADESVPAHRPG